MVFTLCLKNKPTYFHCSYLFIYFVQLMSLYSLFRSSTIHSRWRINISRRLCKHCRLVHFVNFFRFKSMLFFFFKSLKTLWRHFIKLFHSISQVEIDQNVDLARTKIQEVVKQWVHNKIFITCFSVFPWGVYCEYPTSFIWGRGEP